MIPPAYALKMPPNPVTPPSPKLRYAASLAEVAAAFNAASQNVLYSEENRDNYARMAALYLGWIGHLTDRDTSFHE